MRRALLERTGASAPEAFRFYRPRCDRVVQQVLARIAGPRPWKAILSFPGSGEASLRFSFAFRTAPLQVM